MLQISDQIQGWRPKKGLRRAFTRAFSSGTNFILTRGGHKRFLEEAQAPKCTPVAPGCYFLLGHNPRLEGTNSDLGGARTRNALCGAGHGLYCKVLLPKHRKTTIAIIFSLQSAQQWHYVF